MKLKHAGAIAAGLAAIAGTGITPAGAAVALVNFDPPGTPAGPSIYVAVPGPQTIVTAPATFSGGVVLGDATFFPAIAFATAPNVYGTADFGNSLAKSLTISIDPAFTTTEVSFALFNGETFNQGYKVDAFNGANLVTSQTIATILPNFNAGYGLIDLNSAGGITSVVISPTGAPQVWDFLIDSVAFNQNITTIFPNVPPPPVVVPGDPPPPPVIPPVRGHRHGGHKGETELVEINFGDDINDIRGSTKILQAVPEPSTYATLVAGLAGLGLMMRRRKQ